MKHTCIVCSKSSELNCDMCGIDYCGDKCFESHAEVHSQICDIIQGLRGTGDLLEIGGKSKRKRGEEEGGEDLTDDEKGPVEESGTKKPKMRRSRAAILRFIRQGVKETPYRILTASGLSLKDVLATSLSSPEIFDFCERRFESLAGVSVFDFWYNKGANGPLECLRVSNELQSKKLIDMFLKMVLKEPKERFLALCSDLLSLAAGIYGKMALVRYAMLTGRGFYMFEDSLEKILHVAMVTKDMFAIRVLSANRFVPINDDSMVGDRLHTPLTMAIDRNDAETVKLLLDHPDIDVNTQSTSSLGLIDYEIPSIPLNLAVERNYEDIIELLLLHPRPTSTIRTTRLDSPHFILQFSSTTRE